MTKTNHSPHGPDFRHLDRLFGERAVELASYAATLLGWRPEEFWDATPAELMTALGLDRHDSEPVDRVEIERLMNLFPDNRTN